MGDYIDRQAAIDALHETIHLFFKYFEKADGKPLTDWETLLLTINQTISESLKRLPSADVVEVVRCADCRHWDTADIH